MAPPPRYSLIKAVRYLVQAGYLLFYCYLLWSLWTWTQGSAVQIPGPRPGAVDGFLPISGLMGLRYWAETATLHPVHPAAALILLAALLSGLLLKRGFCSWICPVFPLSEGLWRLGRRWFGRNFAPPFWLDLPLRGLKYLLLCFFLWQILWLMPFAGLRQFLDSTYHRSADLRLLQFFLSPSLVFTVFFATIVVLALLVQMPWCRYLCPYGALLGLVSLFSLTRVVRDPRHCVRCGACSARCPAWLPVMILQPVRSAECYACLRCVHGCPAPGALDLRLLRRWRLSTWSYAALLLLLMLAVSATGHLLGRWHSL